MLKIAADLEVLILYMEHLPSLCKRWSKADWKFSDVLMGEVSKTVDRDEVALRNFGTERTITAIHYFFICADLQAPSLVHRLNRKSIISNL